MKNTIVQKLKKVCITVFIIILIVIFLPSHASAGSISKPANNLGLVGYWPFDEGTGTSATDFSGYGTHMNNFGNSPTWVNGKVGKAVNLAATNDIIYGNASGPINTLSNRFTLSIWVKLGTTPQTNKYVFGKLDNSANNNMFAIIYGYNANAYEFFCASCAGGYPSANTRITVTDRNWHHISYTYDGTTLKGYLDTQLIVSNTVNFSLTASTHQMVFGDFKTIYCCNINATLDEARVYSRALTQTEIQSLYNSGITKVAKSPTTNGLVAHWTFDEGGGTTVYDRTGNGNKGTLVGGPSWTTGKLNGGLSFDGVNDYVTIPDSDNLDLTGDFTITLWSKRNSGSYDFLMNKKATGYSQSTGWMTYAYGGGLYFDFIGLNGSYIRGTYTSNTDWHFYTIKKTGGVVYIYQDTVLRTSGAISVTANTDPLEFGRRVYQSSYFSGVMDEVRVYNRALSNDEMNNIYTSTASGYRKINSSQNTTSSSLDQGLVGLWSFNGADVSGTTAYDRSGNGNNGTLTNGPKPTIGKVGQALSFDGMNDYVSIPGGLSGVNGQSQLTISAWVKRNSASSYGAIFDKKQSISSWIIFQFHSAGLYMVVSGSSQYCVMAIPSGTDWKHYTAVFDGTAVVNANRIKIYIDGIAQSISCTASIPSTTASPTATPAIGFDIHNSAYLNGQIDEVRIYNRALSANEVKLLYNLGK